MKYNIVLFTFLIFFAGCSKQLHVKESDYDVALHSFQNSCNTTGTRDIYGSLCDKAINTNDSKEFLLKNFKFKKLKSRKKGLLTGYYEASLNGSLTKDSMYKYPIYDIPNDFEKIKKKNWGKYYTRAQMSKRDVNANIICYVDSKVDLFFLDVQGSGRVSLDDGSVLHVGYAGQNGHKYSSIGKYLVSMEEISQEDISLQSIKSWFKKYPSRVDEILHHNKSAIFFKKKIHSSTGSLGIVLTPNRSIAVDRKYIKLGSMLYLEATTDKKTMNRIVMAQDTGGAIKGKVRADMFLGYGEEAMLEAGELKADLELWLMLPKKRIR